MKQQYPVIGLEIHVELKTDSKMFCQCSADYFGKKPNTHVCPVCLGMPGALPVPNRQAIEWAILIGKALGCTINKISKFDRKHYFYPDLPKGYQISQYDEPFCVNGAVAIKEKTFRIHRVHLEEDTGKLIHGENKTLVDFNRSSVPLVEIVTEPDFHNSDDVRAFLEELQVIIRYLNVSDADMEKGSMRLEPNISLILNHDGSPDPELPKYKVEVKNINSFRYVKDAIEYELKRQAEILETGELPPQETRGYNETKGITYSQRSKEDAHDYRYFPEPDIPPIVFTEKQLEQIFESLPELPGEKIIRYKTQYKLRPQDAFIITRNRTTADYFEHVVHEFEKHRPVSNHEVEDIPQKVANYIINKKIPVDVSAEEFVRQALELMAPKQTDTKLLDEMIAKVVGANPKAVEDYNKGKQNSIMFLMGQVMKEMKGKADAQTVKNELIKILSK
ncbi:MAG: hypothetical protein RI947_1330 [Candidatus Parcubacteria bacterium]|jgi:aspartyl-tRNA(Asn)/glutamyl-tRNA(Gln) amidotransferase subunit B